MNPNIYRDYCNKIIDLCDFAFDKHSELLNLDNKENILKELEKIKNSVEEFLNEKKSIYFLGHSSSGKSTFLNHIFGNIIIPQSTRIETRVISKTHNSDKKQIVITFKYNTDNINVDPEIKQLITKRVQTVKNELILNINNKEDVNIYKRLVKSNNDSVSKNDASVFIKEVNIYYPFKHFKNFVFYDTPGIDSAKDDTDDEVLEILFSKFSSYVFLLFNAGEPAQTDIRKQIVNYKNIFLKIKNKRLILIGTFLDILEDNLRNKNNEQNIKLAIEKYTNDLKCFVEELRIECLDIFVLNLSPKNSENLPYAPLDLKNKVTLGEIEHRINMHSYELYKYFLDLVINEPKRFIQEYIIKSFEKKRSDNGKNITNLNKKKIEEKSKNSIRLSELRKESVKSYFGDYLSGLVSKLTKLMNEEKKYINDNVDKIEKYLNSFKSVISKSIEDDHGGENCNYAKVKEDIKAHILPYSTDLDNYKSKWWHFLRKESTKKEPFQNGVKSDIFKDFMTHYNKAKKSCDNLIKTHYDNIILKNDTENRSKIFTLEKKLSAFNNETDKIKEIINEIREKEDKCIEALREINEKKDKRENEKQSNPFFSFLNKYRKYKNNIN